MRYAIKRIRMRAGVPDYTNETYKNQADFRVKLKRERQVELLGENSMRYFDLRRWKDALTEENQLLQGCNINISDDDTYIADFTRKLQSLQYIKSLNSVCIYSHSRHTN